MNFYRWQYESKLRCYTVRSDYGKGEIVYRNGMMAPAVRKSFELSGRTPPEPVGILDVIGFIYED